MPFFYKEPPGKEWPPRLADPAALKDWAVRADSAE